jgi:hypothetical protein
MLSAISARVHIYEVRPRRDKRGFDLISDALPFGYYPPPRTQQKEQNNEH